MKLRESLLAVYAAVLTVSFGALLLMGARRPVNASFDQITVHRINVVEPDGTMRLVISDRAEFPGSFFMGKEYARTDRDSAGMIFNDDEGTENGGLIFGGSKDAKGVTHSYGHLSFDNYQRDQTLVLESNNDGPERNVYYGLNDDDRPHPLTPDAVADWGKIKAMAEGPARNAALSRWKTENPGSIVQRGYFGREHDRSVAMVLKDVAGRPRLIAKVAADGAPLLQFLDADGKVTRMVDGK